MGASIGIALAPQHGNTPDALLSFADRGLYAAKRLGKGIYRMFATTWSDKARVAVNVSPKQLGGRGLPEAIASSLADSGLPGTRLEIEVTETIALYPGGMMLADLHLIRALGVSVALDDVGVAYSSLALLQLFPFDRINIHRCFVRNVGRRGNNAAILNALVHLGQELGVQVTAEGIEHRRSWRWSAPAVVLTGKASYWANLWRVRSSGERQLGAG